MYEWIDKNGMFSRVSHYVFSETGQIMAEVLENAGYKWTAIDRTSRTGDPIRIGVYQTAEQAKTAVENHFKQTVVRRLLMRLAILLSRC